MSIRVLLQERPRRSIALVAGTRALVFLHTHSATDHSPSSPTRASTSKCMAEFVSTARRDWSGYRDLNLRAVFGTLGLITIDHEVFLCVVTGASKVATLRPGETVEKIHAVEFYCLNSADYDHAVSPADPYGFEDSYPSSGSQRDPLEHPCLALQRMLSNGSFYFSTDFDITNRLQDRSVSLGRSRFHG